MEELRSSNDAIPRRLDAETAKQLEVQRLDLGEAQFRWNLNEDAMATEKLAEGIRNFTQDTRKLEDFACQACTSQ
jgi:transaldolase